MAKERIAHFLFGVLTGMLIGALIAGLVLARLQEASNG